MYNLGLVSISFRSHSPEQIVRGAKAAGLSCIEWGSDVHAPCTDLQKLREIAELQAREGLFCSSYGTYFRLGQDDPRTLKTYIEAAKILGTNMLRLWCGTKGSREYTPVERDKLLRQCRQAAEIAEDNQAVLCMECHNGTLTDDADSALALMEAVNSPAFRMYYQPNQLRTPEENLAYAAALAPWTTHIHVFNWDASSRYPLRESTDLWKQYLRHFPGQRALLLEFMPDDRIESLPAEADALRQITGG